MAKDRNILHFSRRELLGTLFAGAGGAAISGSISIFADEFNEQNDEQFGSPLRKKLTDNLNALGIDPDNLERLIVDFENFETKFDALMLAQGSALNYNILASEYFEQCIEDRQFQIIMLPFLYNWGAHETAHLYNFENYSNEDWKNEIETEYGLTYLQASWALRILDDHMYEKGISNMMLSMLTGAGAAVIDKAITKSKSNDAESADSPKGPWE